jgi:hypothetical protein
MEKVLIKGSCTILGEINASKRECRFRVNIPNKPPINVSINPQGKLIESVQEVDVSKELLKKMEKNDTDNLSRELDSECTEITSGVIYAARRVLAIVKYYLNQATINEGLLSETGIFWSIDNKMWTPLRQKRSITLSLFVSLVLDDESEILVQNYIDSNIQPLVALRHLHRARNETSSRHKWIDATIAAELAIKEFLIIKKPELETLLLEVQSPPINKMYGEILNKYGGTPLPKPILKSLAKGAETRNILLHRPQDTIIDSQQALNYVADVSAAIYHLLVILYPGKSIVV